MDDALIFFSEPIIKLEEGESFIFETYYFQKEDNQAIIVQLQWRYAPLDISAILLNHKGRVLRKDDLVYFNSNRRLNPAHAIGTEEFDATDGEVCLWEEAGKTLFNNKADWLNSTLPLSLYGSVIGPWVDIGEDDFNGACHEQLLILLNKINSRDYKSIAIIATIALESEKDMNGMPYFVEGFKYGDVMNPVVSILEASTKKKLVEYRLNKRYSDCDGVCLCYVEYDDNTGKWAYRATEEPFYGEKVGDKYKGGLFQVANYYATRNNKSLELC